MSIALVIYLILLVIIAIKSFKGISNVSDFFVAKKAASVSMVSGSLVATILGGSAVIGAIDSGERLGGAAAWFMLVGALGLFALIPFVSKAYSLGKYALPDLIGNLYGSGPKIVASIVIPIAWTGVVAAQIIAAAKLLMTFTQFGYYTSAVIAAVVFTGYTIAGGQKSILRTDMFQACLIIMGLALIACFAIFITGDFNVALDNAQKFPFNKNFTLLDLFLLILTYGTTYTAGPDIFSRIFCAKDVATAKKSLAIAAIVLIPVAFIIGSLAVYGTNFSTMQGARITVIANQILPSMLLPFIALALLSVVLSSADTTLLSSTVIICGLLNKNNAKSEKSTNQLNKARLILLVNGAIALILALTFTDIIGTLLLALAIYAGAFTIPILSGLLGFKAKPTFVALAIIFGGAFALAAKLCPTFQGTIGAHIGDLLMVLAFIVNAIFLAIGKCRK